SVRQDSAGRSWVRSWPGPQEMKALWYPDNNLPPPRCTGPNVVYARTGRSWEAVMAKSPGPSWKNRKGDDPAQAGKRSWQHGAADRSKNDDGRAGKRSKRLRNRLLGALGVVAIVSAITLLILYLRGTEKLTVVLLAYSDPTA